MYFFNHTYNMEEFFFTNQKRTVKKDILDNTFLIEGDSLFLKISMNDPCDRIEFHNGPKLVIGGDFFGKGIIKSLCPVKTGLGIKSIRVEVK